MTHENQGKRWPPTAGVEADYITVETNGCGALAAERLRLHGIPHTSVWVGATGRSAHKPPTLEGWSFSVYNGAEEHASGWGSASLADMAPALLAAVGMSDATTAHKRAQVAETRVIDLAHERDGAVEALDITYDKIAKLRTLLFGAGFEDDLLTSVQRLITQRDALADGCRDFAVKAVDAEETIAELREERKDLSAILKRWEDFVRERLPTVTLATDTVARHTDLRAALAEDFTALATENDRHRKATREQSSEDIQRSMSLHAAHDAKCGELSAISRVLGPRRGDESVFDQADRARKILDCWHSLALKHLPDCPQLRHAGHGNAGFDLGTLHFELRSFMSGEISALRERLAACSEREDSIIAALAENAHLRSSLAAADSVVRLVTAALETPEGVLVTEHAANVLGQSKSAVMWKDEAHKAWNYGDQLDRVLPKGGPNDGLLERTVTLAGEVTRLREQCERLENRRNTDAENEAAWIVWAHQWACQLLASPSAENLRWTIGKRIEDMRTDLRVSREVLENIARVTEYPSGTSLVDHVAKVYKNSERANRMTEEVARLNRAMENTGGYGAREAAKALRKENESLRKALDAWQTWGHNRAGVTATLSDNKLRAAIDTYDAAYCAPALTTDSKEALDYLIAHPGHGLTAELALAGAKRLRGHVEHGLPALNPLRSLIELALLSGVNEAHNAWDAEVAKYRDEAAKAYKRLDQYSLRMLIDRALPMWRRGTPEV